MRFAVEVLRVEYRRHTFVVDSNGPVGAQNLVEEEEIPSHNFCENEVVHADEQILSVIPEPN